MTGPLLEVRDLRVEFPTRRGTLRALEGVSFDIAAGEILGVVGESGAGRPHWRSSSIARSRACAADSGRCVRSVSINWRPIV